MAIKSYKPTTPSRRNITVVDYSGLSKVAPEKSLLEPLKKTAGRNSYGRITVRHHGGGNRKKYRVIDFKRDKVGMNAEVMTLEYDPNRSAHIALLKYEDGEKQMCIRDRTNVHMHIIIKGNQNGWRSSERKCIRCQEAQNAGASAPSQAAAAFLRSTGKGRPSL